MSTPATKMSLPQARTFQTYKWIAIAGVVYCVWTVLGGDPPTVVNAMVALLASVPLYPFFIRSMEAAMARKRAGVGSVDPARRPGTGEPAVSGHGATVEPAHLTSSPRSA